MKEEIPRRQMEDFCYKDIEMATNGFSNERLIGKGSHGCVYKGTLKDGSLVAVKRPSICLQSLEESSRIETEVAIYSSLRSSYILNLLGVCKDSNPKILVMEFMPNGSLYQFLHCSSSPPTWRRRTIVALQVARAILVLHESNPSIVHRDIKSPNILLDSNFNAKLADFGLAVRCYSNSSTINSDQNCFNVSNVVPAGTIGYLDPSYTVPGKLSTKNDVFSFGVLLLELVSCRRAMDVSFEPTSIVDWAMPIIRSNRMLDICDSRIILPINMEHSITRLIMLAARCVAPVEDHRPSMAETVAELTHLFEPTGFRVLRFLRNKFLRRRYSILNKRDRRITILACKNHEEDEEDHTIFPNVLISDKIIG